MKSRLTINRSLKVTTCHVSVLTLRKTSFTAYFSSSAPHDQKSDGVVVGIFRVSLTGGRIGVL